MPDNLIYSKPNLGRDYIAVEQYSFFEGRNSSMACRIHSMAWLISNNSIIVMSDYFLLNIKERLSKRRVGKLNIDPKHICVCFTTSFC